MPPTSHEFCKSPLPPPTSSPLDQDRVTRIEVSIVCMKRSVSTRYVPYLENGPCQPRTCNFPCSRIGEIENPRRFIPKSFDEFGKVGLNTVSLKIGHTIFFCFLFREKKAA
jgi:hypothetical protein